MSIPGLPSWVTSDAVVDGRFSVKGVLASGATAIVVAAEHLRLRQLVALKFLRPEYASNQALTTRFLREARAAASLRSEHVVNVTDVGVLPDGAPYLVMEYLEGKSLAEYLKDSGPLSVAEVVEYTLQALEALAEAHGAGIVHRDLKPDNLVLQRREDEPPLLKVIDFGISKLTGPEVTEAELTKNNSFMGSPLYASPEQVRDSSKVDARSDIWSMGVVMFELLTGRTPFEARTTAGLIWEICADEPAPLADLESRVPGELFDIVARCLEKDPGGRFACVQDLARAFSPLARTPACQISIERIVRRRSTVPPVGRTPASIPPVWKNLNPKAAPAEPAGPSTGRVGLVAMGTFALTSIALFALARTFSQASTSEPSVSERARPVVAAAAALPAVAMPVQQEPELAARDSVRELVIVSPPTAEPRRALTAVLPLRAASGKGSAIRAEKLRIAEAAFPAVQATAVNLRTPRVLDKENPFTR